MATLVLTVIGDDRAGLVSALADVVADHGGNWERSQMAELAGKFAGIVMITVPDQRADELTAALEPLHGLLDITAQVAGAEPDHGSMIRLELELMGADHPGIVHDISHVLAEHGVNIEAFETATRDAPMAGGRLFEANAILELPPTTDIEALRASLEALANELMVDIDLDAAL